MVRLRSTSAETCIARETACFCRQYISLADCRDKKHSKSAAVERKCNISPMQKRTTEVPSWLGLRMNTLLDLITVLWLRNLTFGDHRRYADLAS